MKKTHPLVFTVTTPYIVFYSYLCLENTALLELAKICLTGWAATSLYLCYIKAQNWSFHPHWVELLVLYTHPVLSADLSLFTVHVMSTRMKPLRSFSPTLTSWKYRQSQTRHFSAAISKITPSTNIQVCVCACVWHGVGDGWWGLIKVLARLETENKTRRVITRRGEKLREGDRVKKERRDVRGNEWMSFLHLGNKHKTQLPPVRQTSNHAWPQGPTPTFSCFSTHLSFYTSTLYLFTHPLNASELLSANFICKSYFIDSSL